MSSKSTLKTPQNGNSAATGAIFTEFSRPEDEVNVVDIQPEVEQVLDEEQAAAAFDTVSDNEIENETVSEPEPPKIDEKHVESFSGFALETLDFTQAEICAFISGEEGEMFGWTESQKKYIKTALIPFIRAYFPTQDKFPPWLALSIALVATTAPNLREAVKMKIAKKRIAEIEKEDETILPEIVSENETEIVSENEPENEPENETE